MELAPHKEPIKPPLEVFKKLLSESEIRELDAMKGRLNNMWETHKDKVAANPVGLELQTMADLFKETQGSTEWLWEGIIERGDVTMIPADAKAGKSTFLGPMVVAMVRGAPFLGYQMSPSKVIFASEEAPRAVARRLKKLGVSEKDENILRLKQLSLPGDLDKVIQACTQLSANVVIIDTMATFFELENENDNAAMSQVLKPLSDFAHERKISLIIAHHSAASGKAIRGATSIFAAIDQAIHFRKPRTGRGGELTTQERRIGFTDPKRQRGLLITGRHYGEGPNSMIVELMGKAQLSRENDPYEYKLIREQWDEQEDHVLTKLQPNQGTTIDQMMKATGYRKETVLEILRELILSGMARSTGKGVKGDPHKYWKIRQK